MRVIGLAGLILTFALAAPAWAVEHTLVRWKKTGQCEITTHLPLWGDHWVVLGAYDSRAEAERALALNRKKRACPSGKSVKSAPNPLDRDKGPFVFRGARPDGQPEK